MWDRFIRLFLTAPPPPSVPPPPPAPPVALTPRHEREEIDRHLEAARRRLAELQAIAGLDGGRSNYGKRGRDE